MHWAEFTALVLLGVFHGVNPGMGWLFAVSTGMQERSRRALLEALPFVFLGHAVSVGLIAVLVSMLDSAVQTAVVFVGGAVLVAFGLRHVLSDKHLRWAGMRLGRWHLAWWSFVMSTAHGAGLMLLPVITMSDAHAHHHGGDLTRGLVSGLLAAGVHGLAMLATMTAVALVVYEVVGLRILRTAWVNLDQIWAFALVGAGTATLLTA